MSLNSEKERAPCMAQQYKSVTMSIPTAAAPKGEFLSESVQANENCSHSNEEQIPYNVLSKRGGSRGAHEPA